ncbi:MAG TPA: hypothetical protein PLN31_04475 [Azoarcus taiwanensis]|nr:hypothetical protein [Azoarcus taiwanensis]
MGIGIDFGNTWIGIIALADDGGPSRIMRPHGRVPHWWREAVSSGVVGTPSLQPAGACG